MNELLRIFFNIILKIESKYETDSYYTERPKTYCTNFLWGYVDQFRYRISGKYINKNDLLLDLGTGYGLGIKYFDNLNKDNIFIGIDIDVNSLRFLNINKTTNKHYVNCDICNLPFKVNSFNIATCIEVIEHLEEYNKALFEMNRILKTNGKLIISTPNNFIEKIINLSDNPLNPYHKREFNIYEFKNLLNNNNYKISHSVYFYTPLPLLRKVPKIYNNRLYIIFTCHGFSLFPIFCFYQLHLCKKT